jgi:serine/threonine protein kinase
MRKFTPPAPVAVETLLLQVSPTGDGARRRRRRVTPADARSSAMPSRARSRGRRRTRVVVALVACVASSSSASSASCARPRAGYGPPRARTAACADALARGAPPPTPLCAYFDAVGGIVARLGRGSDYAGTRDASASGKTCAAWSRVERGDDAVVDDADRNYCRNGRRGHPLRYGPWCYVDEGTAAWEYCDGIPSCEDDDAEKKSKEHPITFYDDLATLILERRDDGGMDDAPRGSSSSLLERLGDTFSYSMIYDASVDVDYPSPDASPYYDVSGRLKSFIFATAALHTAENCGLGSIASGSSIASAIARLGSSENVYPEYVLDYVGRRLPSAVQHGVVSAWDDRALTSRRAWGKRSRDLYDSLRCAANAAPAVVAAVGHNGLYLGLDYKLSAVFNPMVFRSLDDIDWPDALVDSICAFGENVTESSDDDRNHRAFFELVEALKVSRCADVSENLAGAAIRDDESSSVARTYGSYIHGRQLTLLVPFSIFAGFLVLIVVYAVGRFDFETGRDHSDLDLDNSYLDDADSIQHSKLSGGGAYGRDTSSHKSLNIAGYSIIDIIGRGANSVVYLASVRDPDDFTVTTLVAIKEPHDRYKTKAEIGFLETIKKSDYLCEYLGPVVEPRSRTWMMMFELCQHGSLRNCLKENTYPRDGATIFKAIKMMFQGVAHVHAANLVHRDIKMDNFLVACECQGYRGSQLSGRCRRNHVIKISDLGLAKAGNMMFDSSARLTGTLCYVAPERLNIVPGSITPDKYRLADLYGIGLAAWELLYYAQFGQAKHVIEDVVPDENERQMLVDAQLVMLISTGRMVPSTMWMMPSLQAWLNRCVAFDEGKRFNSIEIALRELMKLERDFIDAFPGNVDYGLNVSYDDDSSSAGSAGEVGVASSLLRRSTRRR